MNFWLGPLVQNLTEMDENTPKRNGILTMAQTTRDDPGSSKITLVLTSDENSTFRHFCQGLEKTFRNPTDPEIQVTLRATLILLYLLL